MHIFYTLIDFPVIFLFVSTSFVREIPGCGDTTEGRQFLLTFQHRSQRASDDSCLELVEVLNGLGDGLEPPTPRR